MYHLIRCKRQWKYSFLQNIAVVYYFSGAVYHDCLVHDIDMSCWVLGELPTRVQSFASALIPEIKAIDDFDTIAFLLMYPSGAIVLGDNSRFSAYGYDQRLEVFGNKGI